MIGTLGPEGTYSHRAALKLTDSIKFYDDVPETAEAVLEGDVEAGIVPIENSIEGSVNATLDVLSKYDVYITGEILVGIKHALIGRESQFKVVASHPQALAQCRDYIKSNYPGAELRSVSSTAEGVRMAREDPEIAAIAHPELAGDGLDLLDSAIQDVEGNTTRFIRIQREPARNGWKTTIIVYPGEDRPGLLYDILGIFKEYGINLTRIESRPSKRELGDYVFHIDFVGGEPDEVLEELREKVEWVDYLGSYDEL